MASEPADTPQPIYTTVAFKSVDKDAWTAFWADIRERYAFMVEGGAPTQAFAVSMGDMFAEQEAVERFVEDMDIDPYDLRDAISAVHGCRDLPALLAEYGVSA